MTEPEITLVGRVLLPDGIERACKMRCRDVERLEIVLPVAVQHGARLLCHVTGLGVVEGVAGEATRAGLHFHVLATPAHLARLGSRLAWHRRVAMGHDDQRGHGRIVPALTEIRVWSTSGSEMAGTLIDVSATGAAMHLPMRPEIGAGVVVGRRRAKVVRHLDDGVAVRFQLPLRPEDVTPEIVL